MRIERIVLHAGCAIVRYAQLSARNDGYTRFKGSKVFTYNLYE